jgi:hypothetical protein
MNQLEIRRALEEKVMDIGGKITGAGGLMVSPFTMDFSFCFEGNGYEVTLVNLEEKRKARGKPSSGF